MHDSNIFVIIFRVSGMALNCLMWLVVMADLTPDRRRVVANNYVHYMNVTKTDAQVLQCNASNKHGYIFANAFLNVLGQYVCLIFCCLIMFY